VVAPQNQSSIAFGQSAAAGPFAQATDLTKTEEELLEELKVLTAD
jgi:hypothetical protein